MAAVAESEYQLLEFELGEKRYCVDLGQVDEIVNNEDARQPSWTRELHWTFRLAVNRST